jgi:hypothetical protein
MAPPDAGVRVNPLTYLSASAAANPFKNNENCTSDALLGRDR